MEQHLSQYRIFYEVARCRNISRAAKELYISQPAISKSITRLEESLDTRLFTRSSRGVQLTREGEVLFRHISSAFESITQGERELKRIHDFHIGHLKIGVSNTLCKYVLLPYLKGFLEQYPHVNISIESQSSNHTLELLDAGKIDLGLVAEPRSLRGLHFMPVMEIHDAFVCTPSYLENLRLREGEQADPFRHGNIILLEQDNVTRKHVDAWIMENDLEINQLLEVTDMTLGIEFAKIGIGISSVVREFVAQELADGTLIELPFKTPAAPRTIGFACPAADGSGTLQEFLAYCQSVLT